MGEYLIANEEEQAEEIKWALSRMKRKARLLEDEMTIQTPDVFFRCLTAVESEHLQSYQAMFPGSAFSLNQKPPGFLVWPLPGPCCTR